MSDLKDHRFRRRVTAWDVARAAGVNQSVVSRAFNLSAKVAPDTRKRLLAIAAELGYAPNALARGLLTGRTRLVGITTVQIDSGIASSLLQKLGRRLLAADLHPLLLPLGEDGSFAQEVRRLFTFDIDALILVSANITPSLVETCTKWGKPVILLNRVAPGGKLHSVRTDDAGGGREAARLLVARGARRIAFVSGPADATTSFGRGEGFAAGLAAADRPPPRTVAGDFSYGSGLAAGRALLDQRQDRPDAVFCANDMMALGVLDAARERALRVPEELQLVGFGDIPAAGFEAYGLTTFRHDLDLMASATVALLDGTTSDAGTMADCAVPTTLIERRSTRPLPPN